MKIGELTARTGCPAETVRFYEAEGLLQAPERASNNYREYGEAHVSRVSFVMRCRSLDMAHDEIRVLLRLQDEPGTPCEEVRAMLDEHANHVDVRIAELNALKPQQHANLVVRHVQRATAHHEADAADMRFAVFAVVV